MKTFKNLIFKLSDARVIFFIMVFIGIPGVFVYNFYGTFVIVRLAQYAFVACWISVLIKLFIQHGYFMRIAVILFAMFVVIDLLRKNFNIVSI
jgi:hypothetical protein